MSDKRRCLICNTIVNDEHDHSDQEVSDYWNKKDEEKLRNNFIGCALAGLLANPQVKSFSEEIIKSAVRYGQQTLEECKKHD